MSITSERFVPKVHPATRPVEPEDPMTLHAAEVEGDPELMLQCVVQEYAWMGWGADQILSLFRDPSYPVLHQLLSGYGEAGVRERIDELLGQMGVFRVQGLVHESPEPEESEPELIQLGIRNAPLAPVLRGEGSRVRGIR
jgi:hypothetical protein